MATKASVARKKRRQQQTADAQPLTMGRLRKALASDIKKEIATAAQGRKPGRPKGATPFQRVQQAREILAKSSAVAARLVVKAAKVAAQKGDSAPAEFLLKHTGANDDKGKLIRPIETSADKLESDGGSRAPTINIGWIQPPAALPAVTVTEQRALPAHQEGETADDGPT